MTTQTDAEKETGQEAGTRLPVPPIPQYYPLSAIAQRLSLSEKTIMRRLLNDPEVLVVTEKRRGIRKYRTYRVPEASILRLLDTLRRGG